MKKITLFIFLFWIGISVNAFAKMEDPDVEGRISSITYGKSEIVVSNILAEKNKNRHEMRIKVKQGMINNYKLRDYVKVKLMRDGKEAAMIELVKH